MIKAATLIRIYFSVLLILLIAMVFNGGLSISSLEKLYFNSLISSYQVVGSDLKRNILSSLRFGKTLDKFVGIHDLLVETKEKLPEVHNVVVVDKTGVILHSLIPNLEGKSWREHTKAKNRQSISITKEGIVTSRAGGSVHTVLPLKDSSGRWFGTIGLTFLETSIDKRVQAIIIRNLKGLGVSTAAAAGFMFLAFLLFVRRKKGMDPQKKKIYGIIIFTLMSAQIGYSIFNIDLFRDNYLGFTRSKAETLSSMIKEDIEYLFKKGLSINRLVGIDNLLSQIIRSAPEISNISILDTENRIRYKANQKGVVKIEKDERVYEPWELRPQYDLLTPLYKKEEEKKAGGALASLLAKRLGKGSAAQENDDAASASAQDEKGDDAGESKDESPGELQGYVKLKLSSQVIGERVRAIILDSGTVVALSFLFMIEMMLLLLQFLNKRVATLPEASDNSTDYGMMRPVIFLYLLGMSLSHSFIPLHMQDLYRPLWGLSKDLVLGLPISMEMLAAGLTLIPVGIWMDRRGWHEPFFLGITFSIAGVFSSGVANDPILFILSRGLVGIGYGLTWIAAQGFVFSHSNDTTRARGVSNLIAGIFAGQICGAAVGGMLAERLGYSSVFYVGAGMVATVLVLSLLFMRSYCCRPVADAKAAERLTMQQFMRYMFDRRIFAVLWFSVVPLSLCIVGILFYFSPIYLSAMGNTQSDIGRVLMIFGLFSIYIAPVVSRFVDKSPDKRQFIFLSGVLGGLGLVFFEFFDGLGIMVYAIVMLGLASSVGVSAQTVFALNAPISKDIGAGKAMSIQRSIDKVGQMLGPIIIGGLVALMGANRGMVIVGLAYIVLAFLFLFFTRLSDMPPGQGPVGMDKAGLKTQSKA